MSQVKFADRLGVTVRMLIRYEHGEAQPRNKAIVRNLAALAREAGVDLGSGPARE